MAAPVTVPGVPAHEWALAPDALAGLDTLAAHARAARATAVHRALSHRPGRLSGCAARPARPGEVVSGEEGAGGAHARFRRAVNAVMRANPQEVVAHGTVISLLEHITLD
ncbi:hypothetical protein [Deinococcus gobiensis]|uniref:Uncharacterized protein n=1 Tax=Deinococcus gobiensis (strain DSM 21396 / JCM 16679 / CGMCC 1.7299 / I-0) TaxID=745776 RepID=H8GWS2_DEIGI|nr:hypothetical protein [Deinococcus gobiensis]AFD25728.1 hypothetical protein DGo_CA1801 [Deinococcus gobiensis I-0]